MERVPLKFGLLVALQLALIPCHGEVAQHPVDEGDFIVVESVMARNFDALLNSGNNAYKVGFYPLAKNFFTEALEIKNISSDQKCVAMMGLIEACLATGDFSEIVGKFDAIYRLTNVEIPSNIEQKFLLRAAIVACLKHDFAAANKILLKMDIKTLEDGELAWYHAVRVVMFAIAADFEAMGHNLDEASKCSPSTDQAAQIQAFFVQFMMRVSANPVEINNLIAVVDGLCKKYRLHKAGYPFAKAYALLLVRAGNRQKALDFLNEQIANVMKSDVQNLQSFRLYWAVAYGLHSADGLSTIVHLLLSSANDELKKQALKLLISSAENVNQRMEAFEVLSDRSLRTLSMSMIRQILFARIRLAVDAGDMDAVQRMAEEISLQFPKEPLMKNIYEALAYLAWQQSQRNYRMVANYLGKMRDLSQDDGEKISLTARIGNAFYLSGAYDIASNVYEEVLRSNSDGIQYDKILCQLIQADIKSNALLAAEQHLQNFRQRHNSTTEYRWHAELLYINALINGGQPTQAVDYLSKLLDLYAHEIQPFYLVKFYLLQAHSMFSRGNYQRANIVSSNICELFPTKSNSAEISQMVSQAMFIKGACEFKLKNELEGHKTFELLRRDYVEHEIAMLSYFEEAEYFYGNGATATACDILCRLSESGCKYSPFAYYKCAEYHKSLGMAHYDDALSCLSALIARYGDHEITYAARLEIADILRMGGKFSDAQLVYEELLKDFPFDKRYHFTEFCLTKAIFAQKSRDEVFIERAEVMLERLYGIVSLDRSLHLEIAAMYCLVLAERSSFGLVKAVGWETLLSAVANESKLTRKDLYWLLQISNILGDCYSDGDSHELESLHEIVDKLKSIDVKK
ncbi:MAG: tetratricopeptide repeat protein [Puniceicoccales bacterium]|jgi:tetratricopeptide (TPR) repeat protein|nr:tetratricopeptide repeat protein [Puniceicoccales bacterium]